MSAGQGAADRDQADAVRLTDVGLRFGRQTALDGVSLAIPAGRMVGLIGPDGVGKSSLFSLVAGARAVQSGRIEALGGDMAERRHREAVFPRIAYMPQGLGKNLYPTLSVQENLEFFSRLFGQGDAERRERIDALLQGTGLASFRSRAAGKLSGGMKQKLGLCCALIHDPDLLLLDEPTTGVDPLSRRQFWDLIQHIRDARPGVSVLVATAYMEEAERFDWLVAMEAGKVLATGAPAELLARTGVSSLEEAFIALLPEARRRDHAPLQIPPRPAAGGEALAIEARGLTMRFGDFTAVDHVDFRIERGEIFGFVGSNGCGKTTTMKMLTGLLPPSEGAALLFGEPVDPKDIRTRARVGYMSQGFSLYSELTVRQNLWLHARLFHIPRGEIGGRVRETAARFDLDGVMDALPDSLPLGQKQRLSVAVATIHRPELLILDEPTSGVDPVARDDFWRMMIDLSRNDGVTIFISTHFMNEAARCDRISLMHAGRVLVTDAPAGIVRQSGKTTLEDAFVAYLQPAEALPAQEAVDPPPAAISPPAVRAAPERSRRFSPGRMLSYSWREALELRRDPIRGALALVGSLLLMLIIGYGVNLDVENLTFAVLDRDGTAASQDYSLNIAGSRYFTEKRPISDYADLDRRMRAGSISVALEIPPGFARNLERGDPTSVAAWVDGAMPLRGETVQSYIQALHLQWLTQVARSRLGLRLSAGPMSVETRFRYNPDVESLTAMVPAVIPLLLLLIPAILTCLSVVREKELGSIINFYVTPVTRLEFLIGKQAPYVALSMVNFLLLTALALLVFRAPLTGSFAALAIGALLYSLACTALGLLVSVFVRTQIAAMFAVAIGTLLPAVDFSGLINPTSSLQGVGAFIGRIYPTTYFITICRGAFSKALGLADLQTTFIPLAVAYLVVLAASAALLKKQER